MAVTAVVPTAITLNTLTEVPAQAAIEVATGAAVTYAKADHKIEIIVANASTDTARIVTITKGNGIQGVTDYSLSIPAGKTYSGVFESGRFVNVSGTYKGKILITGPSTDLTVSARIIG